MRWKSLAIPENLFSLAEIEHLDRIFRPSGQSLPLAGDHIKLFRIRDETA